jgi:uncharacterized protein YndB with AHSA1/START domain
MVTTIIKVEALVHAPLHKVWAYWTDPAHITEWYFASPDWHTPRASNEVSVGGKFNFRMEAKDGSAGFDFRGTYAVVAPGERLECELGDGRRLTIRFSHLESGVRIVEEFDAESENSVEMQRAGWQAILDNFKAYAESD